MTTSACISWRDLAHQQGVLRPFWILARMPAANRLRIARLLGCRIDTRSSAEAQAWRIINQNLRGLQARTHNVLEQLSPFSRNNNWWEILTRLARRCGVRFYPGLSDEEVERLLFDHFADAVAGQFAVRGADPLAVPGVDPELTQALDSLHLTPNGMRALLGTLLASAPVQRSWAWMAAMSGGLRIVYERLETICANWLALGRDNTSRVCAVVATIYLHDLVERSLAEFDLAGV